MSLDETGCPSYNVSVNLTSRLLHEALFVLTMTVLGAFIWAYPTLDPHHSTPAELVTGAQFGALLGLIAVVVFWRTPSQDRGTRG